MSLVFTLFLSCAVLIIAVVVTCGSFVVWECCVGWDFCGLGVVVGPNPCLHAVIIFRVPLGCI